MKTFEQFIQNENDPYNEENWGKDISIGLNTIIFNRDYKMHLYKSNWGVGEDGHECWLKDTHNELDFKEGDEVQVNVIDIDYSDNSVYLLIYNLPSKGKAIVPIDAFKIKD